MDYEDDFETAEDFPPVLLADQSMIDNNQGSPKLFNLQWIGTSTQSTGNDTKDFCSTVDSQTDLIDARTAWIQVPAQQESDSCGFSIADSFLHGSTTSTSTPRHNRTGSNTLKQFIKSSGSLITSMLDEEPHWAKLMKFRVDSSAKSVSLIIDHGQLKCGNMFKITSATNALGGSNEAPTFLLCHSLKPDFKCRFNGLVTGWSAYFTESPQFTLGSYGCPTCAFKSNEMKDVVIAGHCDGSICCWDLSELQLQQFGDDGFDSIKLPSFLSCGSFRGSHLRPVVDLCPIPNITGDKVQDIAAQNRFAFASMDEEGEIFLWSVVRKEADAWTTDAFLGLTPGSSLALICIRKCSPLSFPDPDACWLKSDPVDRMVFIVGGNKLQRIHQDGFIARPAAYSVANAGFLGKPKMAISFSPFYPSYFLIAGNNSQIQLFSQHMKKEIASWIVPSRNRILTIFWSKKNPWSFFTIDEVGSLTRWMLNSEMQQEPIRKTEVVPISLSPNGKWVQAAISGYHILLLGSESASFVFTVNELCDAPTSDQITRNPFIKCEEQPVSSGLKIN